jgi:hypothetical protein
VLSKQKHALVPGMCINKKNETDAHALAGLGFGDTGKQ